MVFVNKLLRLFRQNGGSNMLDNEKKDMQAENAQKQEAVPTETKKEENVQPAPQQEQPAPQSEQQTEPKTEESQQITEVGKEVVGARVEDLVTKDELREILASFEAKQAATMKEVEALKAENDKLLSEKQALEAEKKGLQDKYENHDFGNEVRKSIPMKNASANQTFADYSKQFM